jgi:hypothetical protein
LSGILGSSVDLIQAAHSLAQEVNEEGGGKGGRLAWVTSTGVFQVWLQI